MRRQDDWIETFTGKRFRPLDPDPKRVELEDIAHALSNLCRFTGHTRAFYSVAQHSVLVARAVPPKDALWGLLHDASEAYLLDVARPLKQQPEFAAYREAERRVMAAVCARFKLAPDEPRTVRVADRRMLATEKRDLMSKDRRGWEGLEKPYDQVIEPLAPADAKRMFLETYHELVREPAKVAS